MQSEENPETINPALLAETLAAGPHPDLASELQMENETDVPTELMTPAINEFKPIPKKGTKLVGNVKMTYYKHPMGSARYGFRSGKEASFVNHIFATQDPAMIAELDDEAEHIGLLKATGWVNAQELVDPKLAYDNRIIREYLAKQANERAAALNPNNDRGDYAQPRGVGAANTRSAISADAAVSMAASADAAASTGNPQTFEIPGASNKPTMAALLARVKAAG